MADGEMGNMTNAELVKAIRILVGITGQNMAAPDRAFRILDEVERRLADQNERI